jgi:parallel beta-helix repeat protein
VYNGPRVPIRKARLAVESLEDRTVPSTFLVTNVNDSGPGSLRQAILQANSQPGQDTIRFNIAGAGVHTIALKSALPGITDSLIINGASQPGYAGKPLIELNGANAGTLVDGLYITASYSTVRGLAINRFNNAEIELDASYSTISGDYLGTDATGTKAFSRGRVGLLVQNASADIIKANVISGNPSDGIDLYSCNSNTIQGNLIGVDASGQHALGNGGVGMYLLDSSYNLLGGSSSGQGNVISANGSSGIWIDAELSASIENHVQGNFIGTDRSGTLRLGNSHDGVDLQSRNSNSNSYGNEIGGSAPWLNGSWGSVPAGVGNVIAFNGGVGVYQYGGHSFNNPIRGNSIHDNGVDPIYLDTQAATTVTFTPVVQFAHAGATTTVYGYVKDPYANNVIVDFYANNPSEFGEARRYLGSTMVSASSYANGVASFSASVSATMPGEVVTATATGYYGNTTWLSNGVPAWADVADPTGGYGILQTAIGHEANGRTVVVALGGDVAPGGDYAVYMQTETAPNSAVYGPWQPLYGAGASAVRVTTDQTGRLQVLAIGSDTGLWVDGQLSPNVDSWSGWQQLYGSGLKQIEVAPNYAGQPVVFAIGSDNAVYFRWEYSPGSWSGWYGGIGSFGAGMKSISVARDPQGRLQVFGLDLNGYPAVSTQTSPGSISFTPWQYLGGNVQQLSVTTDASGRVALFALGDDHQVYWQLEDFSGNWNGWQPVYYAGGGFGTIQSLTAGRNATGGLEVVVVSSDGQVYALTGFETYANAIVSGGFGGTVLAGTPTLGNEANGTLDVFAEFNNIDTTSWGYIRL